jgi:predicted Zn-dependent protease
MLARAVMIAMTLTAASGATAAAAPPAGSRAAAESLFTAGEFARADPLYARLLAADPRDTLALRRRGTIALFSNRTADARRWLGMALQRAPGHLGLQALLAECHYREDDFARAAPLLRALGRESRARQLESFVATRPYRFGGGTTQVPFVQTVRSRSSR